MYIQHLFFMLNVRLFGRLETLLETALVAVTLSSARTRFSHCLLYSTRTTRSRCSETPHGLSPTFAVARTLPQTGTWYVERKKSNLITAIFHFGTMKED
jgi:hypothetical protein